MNKKIIIIGGGFAGRCAAKSLAPLIRRKPETSVKLFDQYPFTTMIPALSWIVNSDFGIKTITEDFSKILPHYVGFHQEKIVSVNLNDKNVSSEKGSYRYDYLVIACGSVTNMHGFNQSLNEIYKLDDAYDAKEMSCSLTSYLLTHKNPVCVIVGGGYTGVELACKIFALSKRYRKKTEIVIVEALKELLGLVDKKNREYTLEHIKTLGIRVITDSVVEIFDGKNIRLKTGETFKEAFFCWCAGTQRAISEITGQFDTLPDKRILVNEFLQIPMHPEVFVPADTGAIQLKGEYLRKAVNFAFYSGKHAGKNICRIEEGKKLKPFHPLDLGEVLPLYNTSAGNVMGLFITGKKGLMLHFFMTGYRNFNTANKLEFFTRAITPGD